MNRLLTHKHQSSSLTSREENHEQPCGTTTRGVFSKFPLPSALQIPERPGQRQKDQPSTVSPYLSLAPESWCQGDWIQRDCYSIIKDLGAQKGSTHERQFDKKAYYNSCSRVLCSKYIPYVAKIYYQAFTKSRKRTKE